MRWFHWTRFEKVLIFLALSVLSSGCPTENWTYSENVQLSFFCRSTIMEGEHGSVLLAGTRPGPVQYPVPFLLCIGKDGKKSWQVNLFEENVRNEVFRSVEAVQEGNGNTLVITQESEFYSGDKPPFLTIWRVSSFGEIAEHTKFYLRGETFSLRKVLVLDGTIVIGGTGDGFFVSDAGTPDGFRLVRIPLTNSVHDWQAAPDNSLVLLRETEGFFGVSLAKVTLDGEIVWEQDTYLGPDNFRLPGSLEVRENGHILLYATFEEYFWKRLNEYRFSVESGQLENFLAHRSLRALQTPEAVARVGGQRPFTAWALTKVNRRPILSGKFKLYEVGLRGGTGGKSFFENREHIVHSDHYEVTPKYLIATKDGESLVYVATTRDIVNFQNQEDVEGYLIRKIPAAIVRPIAAP